MAARVAGKGMTADQGLRQWLKADHAGAHRQHAAYERANFPALTTTPQKDRQHNMNNDAPLLTTGQAFELAARCAHEANRAWCAQIGDHSQKHWDDAPDWQRSSALRGVEAVARGESSEQLHKSWMRDKVAAGWIFGTEKLPEAKPPTHPCLVPYGQLPPEQRIKDALFRDVARAVLAQFIEPMPDGTFR